MEAEVVSDIVDMHKSSNVITPESMALRNLIEANEQEGEILLAALRKKGRGRYKNIRENRRKEVLYAQQGDSRKTSENYKLPPANNIVILPGPEARKAWLTKQNDPYKKDK
ncbi:TPA: hypothetical protein KFT63_004072 [Escherichia coli]|nr:hypothetical protein [Escherichia coli]